LSLGERAGFGLALLHIENGGWALFITTAGDGGPALFGPPDLDGRKLFIARKYAVEFERLSTNGRITVGANEFVPRSVDLGVAGHDGDVGIVTQAMLLSRTNEAIAINSIRTSHRRSAFLLRRSGPSPNRALKKLGGACLDRGFIPRIVVCKQ
jgi:hypothetical protein